MLLRNTKKFFQKTLDTVKSFLSSGGYQRLPKKSTPDSGGGSGGGAKLELKYNRELNKVINKEAYSTPLPHPHPRVHHHHDHDQDQEKMMMKKKEGIEKIKSNYEGKRYKNYVWESEGILMRKERGILVVKKLKELEMMDNTNAEHVFDIQQILHYYSRLTCPVYLDIIETFFIDMYSDLFTAVHTSATTAVVRAPPTLGAPNFYVSS